MNIATEVLIPNKERRYQSAGEPFTHFRLPDYGYQMIYDFIAQDQDVGMRSVEKYISTVFEQVTQGIHR